MYRNLKAALAHQRAIEARGGWSAIPPGPKLEPGSRGARVAALRNAPVRLGRSRQPRARAIRSCSIRRSRRHCARFQRANGLDADGMLGPGTLAELNVPIAERIAQIRLNLERGRWLLHDLDPTFVVVNVAGFQLFFLRDNKLVWSSRVQVGKPFRKTPIFRSKLEYLVLNPTWTDPAWHPRQRHDPGAAAQSRVPGEQAHRGDR